MKPPVAPQFFKTRLNSNQREEEKLQTRSAKSKRTSDDKLTNKQINKSIKETSPYQPKSKRTVLQKVNDQMSKFNVDIQAELDLNKNIGTKFKHSKNQLSEMTQFSPNKNVKYRGKINSINILVSPTKQKQREKTQSRERSIQLEVYKHLKGNINEEIPLTSQKFQKQMQYYQKEEKKLTQTLKKLSNDNNKIDLYSSYTQIPLEVNFKYQQNNGFRMGSPIKDIYAIIRKNANTPLTLPKIQSQPNLGVIPLNIEGLNSRQQRINQDIRNQELIKKQNEVKNEYMIKNNYSNMLKQINKIKSQKNSQKDKEDDHSYYKLDSKMQSEISRIQQEQDNTALQLPLEKTDSQSIIWTSQKDIKMDEHKYDATQMNQSGSKQDTSEIKNAVNLSSNEKMTVILQQRASTPAQQERKKDQMSIINIEVQQQDTEKNSLRGEDQKGVEEIARTRSANPGESSRPMVKQKYTMGTKIHSPLQVRKSGGLLQTNKSFEYTAEEAADKIKDLIEKAQQQEQKMSENLLGNKLPQMEDISKPNVQQKEYRIVRDHRNEIKKRIRKQFKHGLVAAPSEEIIKTRTHNHVTYYYIDDKDMTRLKLRKFNEEKAITDFFSEREAFNSKQKRIRRGTMIELNSQNQKLSDITPDEFIRVNKIHPKIFTADQLNAQKGRLIGSVKNIKPNSNKKHGYIQKCVMLIQTLKIAQARHFIQVCLKEFPDDVPLLFNKGLILYLLKDYDEAANIYYSIRDKLLYKNSAIVNMAMCYMMQEQYQKILDIAPEIERTESYLDDDIKNFRKLYFFAREKIKAKDMEKYEEHMKKVIQQRREKGKAISASAQETTRQLSAVRQFADQMFPPNLDKTDIKEENFFKDETFDIQKLSLKRSKSFPGKDQFQRYQIPLLSNYQKTDIERKLSIDTEASVKIHEGLVQFIFKKQSSPTRHVKRQQKKITSKLMKQMTMANLIKNFKPPLPMDNMDLSDNDIISESLNEETNREDQSPESPNFNLEQQEQEQQEMSQLQILNIGKNLTPLQKGKDLLSLNKLSFSQNDSRRNSVQHDQQERNSQRSERNHRRPSFVPPQQMTHPVLQEFNKIQDEIERFKYVLGGEEQMHEFIQKLRQEQKENNKKKSAFSNVSIKKKFQLKLKTQMKDQVDKKYSQYTRAINLLLEQLNDVGTPKSGAQKINTSRNTPRLECESKRTQSAFSAQNSVRVEEKKEKKEQQELRMAKTRSQKDLNEVIISKVKDIEKKLSNQDQDKKEVKQRETKDETEEEKLMRILGINKETLRMRQKLEAGLAGSILLSEFDRQNAKDQKESNIKKFDEKTVDFLCFIFSHYGVQEALVQGSEQYNLFKDTKQFDKINEYINQLSMFVTARSSDLQQFHQTKTQKYTIEVVDEEEKEQVIDKEEQSPDDEIQNYQRFLEMKAMEKMSEQQYEEADFYKTLLQKLNAIDLLQTYVKQCVKSLRSNESIHGSNDISLILLQIFREQASKKELMERMKANNYKGHSKVLQSIDYEVIDKIVSRLKFFRIFDKGIRMKLYNICRYQLIPPQRVIVRKEEIENQIIVLVSGTANLFIHDSKDDITYSVASLFPGESLGDINMTSTLKIKEEYIQTYVKSNQECDVLVFDRKEFSEVLFQEIRESLYEKIITLKNSEFFDALSPYALVILCSNIEIQEYNYGDIIIRQDQEPENCYIIVQGECKAVYETVIYKDKSELRGSNVTQKNPNFHFGFQTFNPDQSQGVSQKQAKPIQVQEKFTFAEQLGEKFSLQYDRIDSSNIPPPTKVQKSQQSISKYNVPSLKLKEKKSEQEKEKDFVAFRQHINYDKLVQGKCFCARSLLDRETIRKFIEREYDFFSNQLELNSEPVPQKQQSQSRLYYNSKTNKASNQRKDMSKTNSVKQSATNLYQSILSQQSVSVTSNMNVQEYTVKSDSVQLEGQHMILGKDKEDKYKTANRNSVVGQNDSSNAISKGQKMGNDIDKYLLGEDFVSQYDSQKQQKEDEITKIYNTLMKSQMTVIADSAHVKIMVISKNSKKYLSEPLKAIIDNKIMVQKFHDYDRPFKNEKEVTKFVDQQKNWDQYKNKVTSKYY